MKFEILKKAVPQVVIKSFFGLLFIFVFALIGVLHTNDANAEEKVEELDWTAAGFFPKLVEQCSDLSLAVFEIAQKLANQADETRETRRKHIERKLEQGVTKQRAEKRARRLFQHIPRLPYKGLLLPPDAPWDLSSDQREKWYAERDRIIAEKELLFKSALFDQCPQIPWDLIEYAYEEEIAPGRYTEKK